MLELVPELVVLPILAAHHSDILALEVLQTLLADLIRIEIDDLIVSFLMTWRSKLAGGAILAILDDLTLGVHLRLVEVAASHVAQIALVVLVYVHVVQPRSHLLRLVGVGLGAGAVLVGCLLIVEGVSGSHLLLSDQVALGKLDHTLSQRLVQLLVQDFVARSADGHAIPRVSPRLNPRSARRLVALAPFLHC